MEHPIVNIAVQAARKAGEVILRSWDRVDSINIEQKQPNDFVTEVDKRAERIIIDTIHKAHPDHGILAEESGQYAEGETMWIIDPLDGTRNFIHGFPHVAVSIGVQHAGRMEHAVIYDPIKKEIFTASRGRGAQLNNRRLRVSKSQRLELSLLGTGFPFKDKPILETYLKSFKDVFLNCGGIRRTGSAALDLAYVAAGRLDGFWEYGLKPWDLAAGSLLITEAGGLISDFEGGDTWLDTGKIVGGNPKIFKAILQIIKPIFQQ